MGNYVSCTLSSPGGVLGQHYHSKRLWQGAKVILPGGEVRSLGGDGGLTKAAELMLETPGFFLVNSRSLHMGRRFSALSADEDLEAANVYVMFPMKRLNSVVTAADMGAMFLAAEAAKKKKKKKKKNRRNYMLTAASNSSSPSFSSSSSSGGGGWKLTRILPAEAEEVAAAAEENWREDDVTADKKAAVPKLNLDDIEDFSAPEFMHRLSMSRSKKPLLETIAEDQPVCIR